MASPGPRASGKHLFRVYSVAISIIVGLLLAVIMVGFISNLRLSEKLQHILSELVRFEQANKNAPSKDRTAFLQASEETAAAYLDEFRSWLFLKDSRAGKRSGDALQFKEGLYSIERRLLERAEEAGVTWPDSFGFERFRSALPTEEQLDDLYYEQELFSVIGNALLDAGSLSVESFNFRLPKAIAGSEEAPHTRFVLDLKLEGSFEQIYRFLDELRKLPHLVSIERFSLNPDEQDATQIRASFEIWAVYL